MTTSTWTGLATVGAALLLGVLGNALLRGTPWGLNLTLWMTLLIAAYGALRYFQTGRVSVAERGLLAGLFVFALCFTWRDSPTLRTLDLLSLVVILGLLACRAEALATTLSGAGRILRRVFLVPLQAFVGAIPLLFQDIAWSALPRTGWTRHGLAALRGLALAIPVLLVFGGLLAGADAVFSHFLGLAFRWDISVLLDNLTFTAVCGWLAAGLLRTCLFLPASPAAPDAVPATPRFTLGPVETGIVLGLLNLLFLGFVAVQLRYFFGGAVLVQATVGLTYAQYARQGFFELTAVAALVLPLLLGLHALQRPDRPGAQALFRGLAAVQVVLLFVIMASAVARMRLYQDEYGLTELRLYTSAFMGWLAVVFLWFAATVLRGQRPRFTAGALLSTFAAVFALHLLDPDAAIVRANVDHAQVGHAFDAAYAAGLSADAVPALVDALPALSPADQAHVRSDIGQEQRRLRQNDWRSWSVSRQRAEHARL